MILNVNLSNDITIHSLNDLLVLGKLEEAGSTKINKSQIARDLGVDRRTVGKYMKGYVKNNKRNRESKIDDYYEIVKELLSDTNTQVFFYKRVLWQYLKDNHGLNCAQSSFRRWISQHKEFDSYFNGKINRTVNGKKRNASTNHHTIHLETPPGYEAQLDWKESMDFLLNTGEIVTINILVLLYSYSRFRVYQLSLTKTQPVLFHLLDSAFEAAGGVPHTLRTDNMKTVMDESRTDYSKGKINNKFQQFAKDYGFEVKPCKIYEPEVKAKVESPMKILDELYAYNGKLDLTQLNDKLNEINNRVNSKCHIETGKIPLLHLQKEKGSLLSLPQDNIRNQYRIVSTSVKVNSQGMISYKNRFYSVPIKYMGKRLTVQVYDDYLHVYDNTKLVTIHQISTSTKRNYHPEHYVETINMSFNCGDDSIKTIAENNLKEIGELYK